MKIYINRYMRYVPTVAVLLLFFTSSIPFRMVSGPSIGFLKQQVEFCYHYWWSSLLLIQNYVNVNEIVSHCHLKVLMKLRSIPLFR